MSQAAAHAFAIPLPPRSLLVRRRVAEPWWQEALRWSAIVLSAGLAAGEATLWLLGM